MRKSDLEVGGSNRTDRIRNVRDFGDYELDPTPIGRGAMGVVYRARQVGLNRIVAIKMMTLAGPLASEEDRRRFHIEAEAAASLDHPNVVPVYEVGERDGFSFLSMKLVDGDSLATALVNAQFAPGERSAQRRAATLVATVARAVHFAHQRGVLHRDLKPANILLDIEGRPHVADFGLAKLLQADSSPTLSEATLGTPSYMAPEQVRGARNVTVAADVYSLGAILYHLLAGRPPFVGESVHEILQQVVEGDPIPPGRVAADRPPASNPKVGSSTRTRLLAIDADLETICLKCLQKDPVRRYATAEELAVDLEHWLRDEPIHARPVTIGERGVKWVRRHRALAVLGTGLCVVILAGSALFKWQRSRAEVNRWQRDLTLIETEAGQGVTAALPRLAALVRQFPNHPVAVPRLVHALVHHSFMLSVSNHLEADPPPGLDWQMRRRIAVAPQDRWWATATNEEDITSISLWSPGRSNPVVIPAHRLVIRSLAASRDGSRLVSASADGNARIWQVVTPWEARALHTLAHPAPVSDTEFSPTGSLVVTAASDGSIRLWNVVDGRLLAETQLSGAPAIVARFSPDGSRVLSASDDQSLRVWNAETLHPIAEPLRVDAAIETVRFLGNPGLIQVSLEDHRECSFALSQVGIHPLLGQSIDLTPFVTKPLLPELASSVQRWSGEAPALVAAAPNESLVAAGRGRIVQVWNVRSQQPHAPPLVHQHLVNAVQFSPDGGWLMTATTGNHLRVWHVASGQPLTEPLWADGIVTDAGFTRDGFHVLAHLSSGSQEAWPLFRSSDLMVPILPDLAESVAGFRLNRKGDLEAAASSWTDIRAKLWQSPLVDVRNEWVKRLLPAP